MKLSKAQVDALLGYIEDAIRAKSAEVTASSDGGLVETIRLWERELNLRRVLQEENEGY